MNDFLTQFENATALQWSLVIALMAAVWFLPFFIALIFNRRQAKLIAIACVPAGLSVFAWSAVLAWAVTGQAVEKYLPQRIKDKLQSES